MRGKDLIGQRFGRLVVIEKLPTKNNRYWWRCKCDCGNFKDVPTRYLTAGRTKSCGCLNKTNSKNVRKDITGEKFGRLTVIEYAGSNKKRKTSMWLCRCECGNEKVIAYQDLKRETKSCGCLLKENKENFKRKYRNGVTTENKRIMSIYRGMIYRCYKSRGKSAQNYKNRGIKVCEEWLKDYFKFEEWALNNGYSEELTIDRIDVNGNYAPENCRWVDNTTQQNNKRNNHYVEINGITKTLEEWSKESGVKSNTILYRIKRGWKGERLLERV